MPRISESELIRQCKLKQEQALRTVVEKYEQLVVRTVVGMLGDSVEAKDISQEVFIRFFQSLKKFRGEAKLSTYLTRIAINLSLNELKRRQRKRRWLTFISKDEKELSIEDLSSNPSINDTKDLVKQALQILEPEFRSVIVLRMMDGYSVKETAEILQMPEGTIASRLSRGQKKLKSILEKIL